jgi:hypothetical protein
MKLKATILAVCSVIGMAASAEAAPTLGTFTATGPGTLSISGNNTDTTTFTYSDNPAGFGTNYWTISAIAPQDETLTVSYDSSGFYAWFQVIASLESFIGGQSTTLYSHGPNNCCTTPSGGFDYTGSVTFDLLKGQSYGFTLAGHNGDSTNVQLGTLSLHLLSSSAAPEPASWALMVAGFGMLGAAMRRRARVGSESVNYAFG